MKILSWNKFVEGILKDTVPLAMTIGVFDGIHLGHQDLFDNIIKYPNSESAVMTFNNNPRYFFDDKSYSGDIYSRQQKLEKLESINIDTVILIDFSLDFSKLSGNDFLELILKNCDLSYLALGNNFRCGVRGMTTSYEAARILELNNVPVNIVEMRQYNEEIISSSRIRNALASGDFNIVNKMLNGVFSLDIADIPQIIRDKTIIIETKNIKQVLPPQGHYVVRIGTLNSLQKCKILITANEILVPAQDMHKLEHIIFLE
jgi:riboflavin kinase / FMN adenylyltransferase